MVGGDRHRHLVSLARKTAVRVSPERALGQLLAPLPQQGAEGTLQIVRLEPIELAVIGREQVHAFRGRSEAEGGQYSRVRWDDDAAYAERVGERASEQRSGTPERHQRHSPGVEAARHAQDRKSTRLNSSHSQISYAVFCLKKKI